MKSGTQTLNSKSRACLVSESGDWEMFQLVRKWKQKRIWSSISERERVPPLHNVLPTCPESCLGQRISPPPQEKLEKLAAGSIVFLLNESLVQFISRVPWIPVSRGCGGWQGSREVFVTSDPTFPFKPWSPAVQRIQQVTGERGWGQRSEWQLHRQKKGFPQFHCRKVPMVGKTIMCHGCQILLPVSTLPELRVHKVDVMLSVCPSKEVPKLVMAKRKPRLALPLRFFSPSAPSDRFLRLDS